jgi:hypothetical protein
MNVQANSGRVRGQFVWPNGGRFSYLEVVSSKPNRILSVQVPCGKGSLSCLLNGFALRRSDDCVLKSRLITLFPRRFVLPLGFPYSLVLQALLALFVFRAVARTSGFVHLIIVVCAFT